MVAWLVRAHGVCIIPGAACGAPGYVRVAFANLLPAECTTAAERLRRGLEQLVSEGAAVLAHGPGSKTEARGGEVLPA